MKEGKRIQLSDLQHRLQARMQYTHPQSAFNALLICFGKHKKHAVGWAGALRRKGWMAPSIAREFAQYVGYPIDQN